MDRNWLNIEYRTQNVEVRHFCSDAGYFDIDHALFLVLRFITNILEPMAVQSVLKFIGLKKPLVTPKPFPFSPAKPVDSFCLTFQVLDIQGPSRAERGTANES
jgi:hypothetical protein